MNNKNDNDDKNNLPKNKFPDINMLEQPLLTEDGLVNPLCIKELESVISNVPKLHIRNQNDNEWNEKHWTFDYEILGQFARWAICLSPYHCPDNLEIVIKYLQACLRLELIKLDKEDLYIEKKSKQIMANISLNQISKFLYDILYEQDFKEFDDWNSPKNDRCKGKDLLFTSRYDEEESPDDYFIDLDALLTNVCIGIRTQRREDKRFDEKFESEYGKLSGTKQ